MTLRKYNRSILFCLISNVKIGMRGSCIIPLPYYLLRFVHLNFYVL